MLQCPSWLPSASRGLKINHPLPKVTHPLLNHHSFVDTPACFAKVEATVSKEIHPSKPDLLLIYSMATSSKSAKYVYTFGNKKADGDGTMKPLLGGKGANLAEMSRIGLPVPPGFTITTDVCTYYYAHKRTYPKELQLEIENGIANMERIIGTRFGDIT